MSTIKRLFTPAAQIFTRRPLAVEAREATGCADSHSPIQRHTHPQRGVMSKRVRTGPLPS
jgi:hypothetical protein